MVTIRADRRECHAMFTEASWEGVKLKKVRAKSSYAQATYIFLFDEI